jgi:hypothetical protein
VRGVRVDSGQDRTADARPSVRAVGGVISPGVGPLGNHANGTILAETPIRDSRGELSGEIPLRVPLTGGLGFLLRRYGYGGDPTRYTGAQARCREILAGDETHESETTDESVRDPVLSH